MEQRLLEPGSTFAERYRIEKYLAQGGFGAVYVAEQLATEARVAIKVLWPHVLQSNDAVEKFRQEARIAGRVNSEHIVRIIDAGLDDATRMPFLAMELLNGEDLQRVLERSGPIPPELVVRYLKHVASALDKAHRYTDRSGTLMPIVHRDLKPENLFLTHRENGDPLIKVLDFGIAKVLSGTSNMSQEVKGTPLFMAFEQAAGGAITPQTDVWALGLVAFYLLTGESYWRTARDEDGALMQLFGEVMQLPLDTPTQRLSELERLPPWTPDFDVWFSRCVNRDRSQRFASAGAAVSALSDALGVTITASNPSPSALGTGPGPWSTPQPGPTPPGSGVVVARSGEGPTLQSVEALPHAQTAQGMAISGTTPASNPKSRGAGLWIGLGVVVVLFLVAGTAAVLMRGGGPAPTASQEPGPSPAEAPTTALASTAEPSANTKPPATPSAPAAEVALPTAATPKPMPVSAPKSAPRATKPAQAAPAAGATSKPNPKPVTKPSEAYIDR